ncbi:MAG: hypothetical protein A2X18_06925 [Bacteroidetes bacterium GWF2_40_14]|nr:MAG: hypothetical protein A2X18_06925 [Bacteroidetes bacterium GWF2_40_14]
MNELTSEIKWHKLVQTLPDFIALYDRNGKYIYLNHFAKGFSIKDIEGKSYNDFLSDDSKQIYDQAFYNAKQTRLSQYVEHSALGDNKISRYYESYFVPIFEDDVFVNMMIIARDITTRKETEKRLRESEANARAIMESTDDIFILLDKDGIVVDSNEAHAKRINTTRKELLKKNVFDLLPKDVADRRRELVNKVLSTGKTVNSEDFRAGYWNESTFHPVFIDNEITDRVAIFSRNITDRKLAEEELKKTKKELSTLMNNMPGMVYSCMNVHDWTMNFISEGSAELTGYSPEELIENKTASFNQVIHPDDREAVWETIQDALERHASYALEYRIVAKSGAIKHVWERGQGFYEQNGNLNHLEGFITDISEKKRFEEELKDSEERLRVLNASKDKFFSIIAHDLRSPLNSFLGLTQIMAEELPDLTMSQVQEIAAQMSKSARNLNRLIENLLQWAQIQKGAISFNPENIDFRPLIDECIDMIQESARIKGIEITVNTPDKPKVVADSNIMKTVIRNLVSNAVKFCSDGGKINLSVTPDKYNNIIFSVMDSGIGMSKSMLDSLFMIDVQNNRKGTKDEPSTGLGLLLCKEFVEMHGGRIWAESKEGEGSTFYFTIPANTYNQ